ncbi:MAG TPA: S46 family peptidase [Bacteroidales bacterium]|nr:S46 family peptidase [Bacteroidales bacterium]HPT03069.1 S46 family peptidase [Bacteroidales bacterium]
MKKYLLALCMLVAIFAKAAETPDEGMWLPMFVERLNYVDMQKMGLRLTPEELYSINHSSLKDAIVSLGGFCTAEVVSPEGLLFTNHHCGYGNIQKHSTVDHDYLTDGFWAMSKAEELPNEGLTVSFLERMADVTTEVLGVVTSEMDEQARQKAISGKIDELKKAASEEGKYQVELKSFFNGNEYYMFVYQVYKDVRLVGAPPSSIGKFGGDTDNWMWPRHTGDFSIFRIYTAPDGSPAEYSKDNVPLKPKHYLPVSLKGYEKNDFAMIWGFPGQTDRYRTSWGVDATLNDINPVITKGLGKILEIQKAGMDADNSVRIAYADNYAGLANFWKNKVGETRDLKRLGVVAKKQELEKQFADWVNATEARKQKYGNVLSTFSDVYAKYKDQNLYSVLWHTQMILFGSQAFRAPGMAEGLETVLKSGVKGEELAKQLVKYREFSAEQFKEYNIGIEQNVLAAVLEMFYTGVPKEQQPEILKTVESKYKGCFHAYAADLFKKSIWYTPENFNAFLDKPSLKKLQNDPTVKLYSSFMEIFKKIQESNKELSNQLRVAQRLFAAGLREMEPDKSFYPDANSTMRMTYGKVLDYYPADAVHYKYYTTLDGVMAKEDPTNEEFIVPARLKDLYQKKDYGQYGVNGTMYTCFLTDNDITGGNSGSPVLNADGQLIGLAFDGNWEAMSGNILFEPELQRTICVDVRYVLFIIDKFAGATNLINELTLVK